MTPTEGARVWPWVAHVPGGQPPHICKWAALTGFSGLPFKKENIKLRGGMFSIEEHLLLF